MNEAEQNAETVRRGCAAFNSADMKTLAELFDESASWHTPGRSPIAGDHKGREAVFARFGRYGGETGGTFKAVPEEVGIPCQSLISFYLRDCAVSHRLLSLDWK